MAFILRVIILLGVLGFPPKAGAIVILPAVVLIPLVKLIALVVGAFSVPIASTGVILARVTKNYKFAVLVCFLLILLIGILATIILRLVRPENPWF